MENSEIGENISSADLREAKSLLREERFSSAAKLLGGITEQTLRILIDRASREFPQEDKQKVDQVVGKLSGGRLTKTLEMGQTVAIFNNCDLWQLWEKHLKCSLRRLRATKLEYLKDLRNPVSHHHGGRDDEVAARTFWTFCVHAVRDCGLLSESEIPDEDFDPIDHQPKLTADHSASQEGRTAPVPETQPPPLIVEEYGDIFTVKVCNEHRQARVISDALSKLTGCLQPPNGWSFDRTRYEEMVVPIRNKYGGE